MYERLLARYRDAATPQDQLRHLYALAEFDSEALVLRTCELALSDEVKTQNAPFLLRTCIANRRHGAAAWQFVRRHWDEANAALPEQHDRAHDRRRCALLTDEAVAADVQAFFAEHPIEQAAKTLDQILERQRVNVALRAREAEPFRRLALTPSEVSRHRRVSGPDGAHETLGSAGGENGFDDTVQSERGQLLTEWIIGDCPSTTRP